LRFFDPALIESPYAHYRQWREQAPVFRDEESSHWVVSRQEDVLRILKNHKTFSSSAFADSEQTAVALPLLSDDPPRHTQLRALVNRAFTSRTLKAIEPEVERLSRALAGAMATGQAVDVAAAFTTPLPVAVISNMMDIPAERGEDFKRWSDALTGTSEAIDLAERMPDIMEMAGFFSSLIPGRREHPGDDLISKVVNAEVDGERLSDEDITGFCMLLLIAGNETTTNLLSNLLNHAAGNPGVWEALRQDRGKIDAAVEEILRYDAPVQFVFRTVTEDTELHGETLEAGDFVVALMAGPEYPLHLRARHPFLHRRATGQAGGQVRPGGPAGSIQRREACGQGKRAHALPYAARLSPFVARIRACTGVTTMPMTQEYIATLRQLMEFEANRSAPPEGFPALPAAGRAYR
jgi:cytochrome P450